MAKPFAQNWIGNHRGRWPDVRNTPLEDCYHEMMAVVFAQIVKPDSKGAI